MSLAILLAVFWAKFQYSQRIEGVKKAAFLSGVEAKRTFQYSQRIEGVKKADIFSGQIERTGLILPQKGV